MPIRKSALAACLAGAMVAPGIAHAQESDFGQVTERLNDPATQMAVTAALVAMSEALMQIEIGPFARAAEAAGAGEAVRDLPPDATVRDLAGPDAQRMQRQLARRTPEMMGAAAGMAGALEEMLPRFREMARKMKDAMPHGSGEARP
ncbi:MAG: hypothetical protein KDE55_08800 [Novosphingobium sp.]|nr:hypothetical protein [Novosphingobium sp.]